MLSSNTLHGLEEIQDHFTAFLSEWKERIPALRSWALSVHVTNDHMPKFTSYSAKTGAYTEAWSKYEDAVVNLYLPEDEPSISSEELEETAIHELMHILISPWNESWKAAMGKKLTEALEDVILIMEEQVCTRLACGYMRTKYPTHEEGVS